MLKSFTRIAIASILAFATGNACASEAHDMAKTKNLFDFSLKAIDGSPYPLAQYRGKVIVLINTATECGFAPQLKDMQTLWEKYQDKNVVIISVPSNDYNHQEPRKNAEIKSYCETKYHATYPIVGKIHVRNYEKAHPLFRWIADRYGHSKLPAWNFSKYVFDGNGVLVDSFSSITSPTSDSFATVIDAALAVPVAEPTTETTPETK